MSTKKKSDAVEFLEKISGGPLTVSKLLVAHRESNDLTQAEVAKKLGVSIPHLSQLERGHKFLSPERAYAFAKKLGLMPEVFVMISIQDQLTRAKLPLKVKIEAA
ncbi:helix-turn-helix domain-containing protein [Bdellovibrio sp. HCB209]|uniref:helix-turn-helix domain-containing protein n=1 Tax=Bdellovibrio sp. HCB209 TaxID=3394354 RepID=UPI0039B5DD21